MSMRDEDFQTFERTCSVQWEIQIHICPGPSVVAVSLYRQKYKVPQLHTLCDEVVFYIQITRIKEGQTVGRACNFGQFLEALVGAVDVTGDQ